MKKKEIKLVQERFVRKPFQALCGMGLVMLFVALTAFNGLAGDNNSTASISGPPEFVDINVQKSCPDIKGLKKDIKSVNHFSHKAHIEALKKEGKGFVCAQCHNGAKTEDDVLKADKCKRLEKELEATGGAGKLKNHFHDQCLKCHKELKKENKPTGPTSCKGCHNRKGGAK